MAVTSRFDPAAARQRHALLLPVNGYRDLCRCGAAWPCDVAAALARIDELESGVKKVSEILRGVQTYSDNKYARGITGPRTHAAKAVLTDLLAGGSDNETASGDD